MNTLFSSLSLLPIATLLVVSLLKGVKAGIYTGLVITSILFFAWDSHWIAFPASLAAALIDTISILMIVFGALLLHQNMEQVGFIDRIKTSLKGAHRDAGFQFYFLAFFLTAFFESVAGFGTPGAIVPLLLVSLGFSPVLSIIVVLLIDGLFAIAGAIGTPVTAGFEAPLSVTPEDVKYIYVYASFFMLISGAIIVFFIQRFVKRERPDGSKHSWKLYLSIALPFVCLSFFLKELTGVIAATLMGAFAYFFLFTQRKIEWKPWIPYGILVLVLLLPKLNPSLASFISWSLTFDSIFTSTVDASLQPLKSPLLPFVLASFVAAFLGKNHKVNLKPVLNKTSAVFLILFPSLAITRLMLSSGGTEMPSMVEAMSLLFAETGSFYPIVSPFIGLMGTFITGSTTVSNIIFGPVQFNAAGSLGLPHDVILAMQLTGASLGNAVCLFNIIAASAVAGVDKYSIVLSRNMLPILLGTIAVSLVGLLALVVM
ncbi:MAG: L-lactate permease [Bacteroidota bacterium]